MPRHSTPTVEEYVIAYSYIRFSHPDQATIATPSGNNTHALFVGAFLDVDLAQLLGLPSLGH